MVNHPTWVKQVRCGKMSENWSRQRHAALRNRAEELLEEHYLHTHSAWVEGHLELLCDLRAAVGNDLDKVIIIGVIGQCMIKALVTDARSYKELVDGSYAIDEDRLTNIESVSASTGLPRESVRRKVWELIEAGWLARTARGRLTVEPAARIAFKECSATEHRLIGNMTAKLIGLMGMPGDEPNEAKGLPKSC
jgi:hypothetical protein